MAKDPAFLFYPGDWQGGTSTFSKHLKGCYMDVLIAQFNSGPLSLEEIKTVLGSDFGTSWPTLQKKFKTLSGLFFNERLETEKEKRKEYSKSRSENRSGKNKKQTHDNSYEKHMTTHMDNENENKDLNEFKIGGSGERDGIVIYGSEKLLTELDNSKWLEELSIHFKIDHEWDKEQLKLFAGELKVKNGYSRILAEIKNHYFNWLKIQIDKKDKKNYDTTAKTKQPAFKPGGPGKL